MKNTPKYLQIAQAMKDMVQKGKQTTVEVKQLVFSRNKKNGRFRPTKFQKLTEWFMINER
jgi:hypothetical protein